MVSSSDIDASIERASPAADGPGHPDGITGSRVDLGRVLTGLRHLDASGEPALVFTGLAEVCVPALCDECLIQITEHDHHPYRIRRTGPTVTPGALPTTDEAFTAAITGTGRVVNGSPAGGGATSEITDQVVLARFGNPPGGGPDYHGVLICRWHTGHTPQEADAGLVGVLADQATALIHRERTTSRVDPEDPAGHLAATLNVTQRIAAGTGILMALHHLPPTQARQLLGRASEHTHRPVSQTADTVLRTGALPENHHHAAAGTHPGPGPNPTPPTDVQAQTRG
jgi:hypothetical protein